ncbi:phosphatase PAP2 family protein [Streptomyces sp. NPDC004042]|uniref:bifunctional glycosyltransferase 87/phosphatase PAP2 family protein n=1 Tax=Streptomyces sp. NPDC004042 TaxID=3154451 RepID=UPI00339E2069
MADAKHSGGPVAAFGGGAAAAAAPAGGRLRAARLGLWLIAGLLAIRQVAVVLATPRGDRLTDLETWVGPHGVLHVKGSLYETASFTGTPFSGLVLKPLTNAAERALGWSWIFGTLLLVVALGLVAARALPQPAGRRTALLAAPVAISLLMLSLPVRNAFWLGQTGVLPVLLVLLGLFAVRGERTGGLLVGLAAALQPTTLLFAPLLWCTGRRRAAAAAGATFATGTALAWAAMPHDSAVYWIRHCAGTGLGGPADARANQSLHGALLRFGLTGPLEIALFLALAAAVAVLALRRAVRYAHDGQLLLAVAVTGCAVIAVSPTAWQHQLLWVLLSVAGRAGRRASDRYVWPVAVVLVLTLPARAMLPQMAVLNPLRDNLVLLAALAAATAVPFLSRADEHYRTPVATRYADPVPARLRHVPLVPFLRRVLTRPNLLLELLLIRVTYAAYSQVRVVARGDRATAEHHGRQVHSLEHFLHLDIEHWANHAMVRLPRLDHFLSYYYETFHFVLPLTVLGVLYLRRPADYRWARTALGVATLLALVGFWLYPLAPPRLMPGFGFIDTVHGVQDFSKPEYGALTALTNPYAAMPSLHFGWALWCGVVIAVVAPRWWMKALGLLHPLFTVSAIIGTANHWVLDAVGGATVVATGFTVTYLLSGPRARTTATRPPELRKATPAPVSGAALTTGAVPSAGAGSGTGPVPVADATPSAGAGSATIPSQATGTDTDTDTDIDPGDPRPASAAR